MASRELNILIKAKNLASAAIKGVTGDLKGLEKMGVTIGRGIRTAGQNIERGVVLAGGAAATGLGLAIKTAIDFEDAFAGVKKTIDETELAASGLTFDDINNGLREMSRTMPIAFEDLAGIAAQAGALGVKAKDILEFTRVTALIGTTTNVSSEDAATALGQLQNVIGLTAKDYDNFGAALVDLGNKGASTEAQILELASRSGAAAKLIGVSKSATLGWSAAVSNLGVEAEAGGTALQQFFLQSLKNLKNDKTLQAMAKTAGTTGAAFKKAFDKDATGALSSFLAGLGKLSKTDQLQVLDDLGLSGIRLQRVLLGLAGNNDNLTASLKTSSQAWKDNSALTAEAQKRFETTQSRLQIVKNNLRDVGYTIGSAVLPIVKDLTDELVKWINLPTTQAGIKQFAQDVADGIRDAVKWAKSLDWEAIGNALKAAAGAGKLLVDAFLAMPSWVQVAVASGWGLNKLTGGALTSLIGQLGSGLIKGILNMNAGVVNIKAGVVTGVPSGGMPTGPAPGPPVPPGGFLAPSLLTAAGGIFAAFAMTGVVPYLFRGAPGSGAKPLERKIGTDASGKPIVVTLDQKTSAMFQGLMPSFQQSVLDAGGRVVGATERSTNVIDDSVRSAKAYLGTQLQNVRTEQIRAGQQQLATKLATDRGFATANAALHDVNANVSRVAAKDFSPNINVTASFLGQFQISATSVASKVTILSNATRVTNMIRRQGGIVA